MVDVPQLVAALGAPHLPTSIGRWLDSVK